MVLLVGVGIGLGWLKSSSFKKRNEVANLSNPTEEKLTNRLPVKNTVDFDNQELKTVEIVGVVESWVPENGKLKISSEGIIWDFEVNDLTKTSMMVNSLKERGRELLIKNKDDLNWLGGFCKGDQVVVRLMEKQLILVVNNGPRSCGFKVR